AALIEQGTDIFQRGSMIVRPSLDEQITLAKGRTTHGMRLVPVKSAAAIGSFMTASADFQKFDKQMSQFRSVDCPNAIAEKYLTDEGLWKLRHLAGTINAPTLRPDGSVLDQPGYDAATG